MLFAQIPTNILKKISADLKINLGVISVTLKEKKQSEKTRFDKVKVVSNYIENHLDVGDIEYPRTYFKARHPMRWLRFDSVYFSGETERTTFVLAGSIRHIIGAPPNEAGEFMSYTPYILSNFAKFASEKGVDIEAIRSKSSESDPTLPLINEVSILASNMSLAAPKTPLEFLSKRLLEGSLDSKHILLGSPIYVASAD